jgi:hypothetical protein
MTYESLFFWTQLATTRWEINVTRSLSMEKSMYIKDFIKQFSYLISIIRIKQNTKKCPVWFAFVCLLTFVVSSAFVFQKAPNRRGLAKYVNPFIGTVRGSAPPTRSSESIRMLSFSPHTKSAIMGAAINIHAIKSADSAWCTSAVSDAGRPANCRLCRLQVR